MQKKYRLKSSRSFDIIYKKGRGVSEPSMTLVHLASKYNNIKVGFVTGKKVGKSVVRNKVKRRMREAFRTLIPRVKEGYSYIFVAKAPIAEMDYHEILLTMERILVKAEKIK